MSTKINPEHFFNQPNGLLTVNDVLLRNHEMKIILDFINICVMATSELLPYFDPESREMKTINKNWTEDVQSIFEMIFNNAYMYRKNTLALLNEK